MLKREDIETLDLMFIKKCKITLSDESTVDVFVYEPVTVLLNLDDGTETSAEVIPVYFPVSSSSSGVPYAERFMGHDAVNKLLFLHKIDF